jgi:hypothetical protein
MILIHLLNRNQQYLMPNPDLNFNVVLDMRKPSEERREPIHGGLTAANLLPATRKV